MTHFKISYRPPVTKVTDKVMIPQEEHPDINFVGLLIGPRGNTLKNLEKDVSLQYSLCCNYVYETNCYKGLFKIYCMLKIALSYHINFVIKYQ